MHSLRQRINTREESGFTLIELLVVLIIIGILLAIAVPSYLGFRDKAQQTSAAANVREAIPSAEAFYSDQNTYVGLGARRTWSDERRVAAQRLPVTSDPSAEGGSASSGCRLPRTALHRTPLEEAPALHRGFPTAGDWAPRRTPHSGGSLPCAAADE